MYYIIIGIIIFISILTIFIKAFLNKVDIYKIKINEANKNIDILLEKKLSILTKVKEKLKDSIEDNFMEKLPKIKNQSLDNFELDSQIKLIQKELKELLEYNKKIILDDETNILLKNLEKTDIDLIGTKKYYNDNAEIYNELISKFPMSIIAKLKRHHYLETYDNKKEEEFEILKEK